MNYIFEAIQYIGKPITLIAFIFSIGAYIYQIKIKGRLDIIKSVPEKERSTIIEAEIETYQLKNDNLTKDQKYKLVIKVIEEKANRFKITAISLVIIALLFSVSTVFVLQKEIIKTTEQDLTAHKTALYPKVANHLQNELSETGIPTGGGKGGKIRKSSLTTEDEYYRRLRKAIFLNLLNFQANNKILEGTLNLMIKRGFNISEYQKKMAISELENIKKNKLRWLEDLAIPALKEDIKKLSRSVSQSSAQACVNLPEIAWILKHKETEIPKECVSNITILENEVSLLKKVIQ